MWKIKLVLEGDLVHTLNDVRSGSPGWANCQPSKISSLTFPFFGKDEKTGKDIPYQLYLAGMSEYNFFVEAMQSLLGGKVKIKGLWFLGKIPNTNKVTGFVLRDSVLKVNAIDGKEYSGLPTIGWKQGVIGDKIISTIVRGK